MTIRYDVFFFSLSLTLPSIALLSFAMFLCFFFHSISAFQCKILAPTSPTFFFCVLVRSGRKMSVRSSFGFGIGFNEIGCPNRILHNARGSFIQHTARRISNHFRSIYIDGWKIESYCEPSKFKKCELNAKHTHTQFSHLISWNCNDFPFNFSARCRSLQTF